MDEATATSRYLIAVVSSTGAIIQGPEDVTATAVWGERDDWITHPNGDVGWVSILPQY